MDANAQSLGAMDQRLGAMDQRLGVIDQRLGAMDQRLEAVNRLIDANHRSLNDLRANVNERFDALQDRHIAAETAASTGFSLAALLWGALAAAVGCVLTLVAQPILRSRRPS